MAFCRMMWSKNLVLFAYIPPQPGHATTFSCVWLRRCSRSLGRPLAVASQSGKITRRAKRELSNQQHTSLYFTPINKYLSIHSVWGTPIHLSVFLWTGYAFRRDGRTTPGFHMELAVADVDRRKKHIYIWIQFDMQWLNKIKKKVLSLKPALEFDWKALEWL